MKNRQNLQREYTQLERGENQTQALETNEPRIAILGFGVIRG